MQVDANSRWSKAEQPATKSKKTFCGGIDAAAIETPRL
jgi:hypothetical protein